jgi:Calx-beta domain
MHVGYWLSSIHNTSGGGAQRRRRRRSKPLGRVPLALASLVAVGVAALVVVTNVLAAESHLDASCESGPVANETSTTGSVSHIGSIIAMADAAERTVRAQASVHTDRQGPASRYCSVLTRFDNAVTVGAGTSGRAVGDPVTLEVTVDLRGSVAVGYHGPVAPADQRAYNARSEFNAQFSLTDPDRPVCVPDGDTQVCRPAKLAGFAADARREEDGTVGWAQDPNGAVTESYRWFWELTGNRGDRLGGQNQSSSEACAAWPVQLPCEHTTPMPAPQPDVNGVRTVLVDTFVGARLELSGLLSILPQASVDARASADFREPSLGRHFSVDLAPAPGFGGLELTYDLGGTPAPFVTLSDASVTEGDGGTRAATFTAALSGTSTTPVTVDFATADGTASAGVDYTAAAGTITFDPGDTQQTVTVDVTGDTLAEVDETFSVELANPQGAVVGDGRGDGIIVNDDGAIPTLSIGDVTVGEGTGGTTPVVVEATLSAPAAADVVFDFATSDGTAAQPADYTGARGTLTIPAGTTRAPVLIVVAADSDLEPDETFTVAARNVRGATLGRSPGTVTITDDDNVCVPRVTFDWIDARGCFLREGTEWRAVGDLRVNGLDLMTYTSSSEVMLDPVQRRVYTRGGKMRVRAGSFHVGEYTFDWRPSGNGERAEKVGAFYVGPEAVNNLKGIPIADFVTLNLTRSKQAELEVPVLLPLKDTVKIGDTTLRGEALLVSDNDRGLYSDTIRITARNIPIPPVVVKNLSIGWDEARERWEGDATVVIPTPDALEVTAGFAFERGRFAGANAAVENLNAPIGGGVFVQAIKFGIVFDPLELAGGIGLSAGPLVAGRTALRVDGVLSVRFADPLAIRVAGSVHLMGFPLAAGYFHYYSSGTVEFGGILALGLPDPSKPATQPVRVVGTLGGWVDGTLGFSARAVAQLRVLGFDIVGAELLVSSVGAAACGNVTPWLRAGFGYRWETRQLDVMGPWACSVAAYEPVRPVPDATPVGSSLTADSTPTTAISSRLALPASDHGLVLKIRGDTGAPKVTLTGPGGRTVTTPADPGKPIANDEFVVMQDEASKLTIIAIRRPQGDWTLTKLNGSPAVMQVEQALVLPPPSISASVSGAAADELTLGWRLEPSPGQMITLVEEGDEVAQVLARTNQAKGTLAFDAAAGPSRSRKIVAVVEQNGIARERIVVAQYTAPLPDVDPDMPVARKLLVELRRDLGRTRLAHEIRTDLLTSLRKTRRALVRQPSDIVGACAGLSQFRADIERHTGSPPRIPAAKAAAWVAAAQTIRTKLGCG